MLEFAKKNPQKTQKYIQVEQLWVLNSLKLYNQWITRNNWIHHPAKNILYSAWELPDSTGTIEKAAFAAMTLLTAQKTAMLIMS